MLVPQLICRSYPTCPVPRKVYLSLSSFSTSRTPRSYSSYRWDYLLTSYWPCYRGRPNQKISLGTPWPKWITALTRVASRRTTGHENENRMMAWSSILGRWVCRKMDTPYHFISFPDFPVAKIRFIGVWGHPIFGHGKQTWLIFQISWGGSKSWWPCFLSILGSILYPN